MRSMRFSSWMWRRPIGSGDARGKARETMKTVTFMASVLKSLAPVIGCTDSTEQRLTQAQNELAQVFRTAWRKGGIRMQRASDHLTVVIAERLLFDTGVMISSRVASKC